MANGFSRRRAYQALRAHWTDRELDFEFGMQQPPLLAPIANPVSRRGKEGERFTADSIGQLRVNDPQAHCRGCHT